MEEMYKKVYIKTEADLPKEPGFYFTHYKDNANTHNTQMSVNYFDESIKGLWFGKDWYDWYLQPCPPQLREVTDEEINRFAGEYAESFRYDSSTSGWYQSKYDSFLKGAKWAIEQMKGGTK